MPVAYVLNNRIVTVREVEKSWERGDRSEGRERVREKRREWREKVREVKGNHWCEFLEGLDVNESYRWIKTDRDFIVDLPPIKGVDGRWYEEDGDKGREIVRGLGKREELLQEEEGGVWDIGEDVTEEEVEEVVRRQKDRKAPGENGLGGKVLKLLWEWDGGKKVLMGIYRRSLELGYVCKRWRRSVGIVMRKPNKPDYSKLNSYRVINLLDVIGKGLERLVVMRMERWVQRGTRDSQFGARRYRSSMEAVGSLYRKWEEGGREGVLLCMDVMGGYENEGVRKMDKRLEEVGVDMYLRKWVSSFLRERVVRVKIGSRMGEEVKMKGGTVQGSPLSPVLFMFLLGAVLEKVEKRDLEGVSMVAVVDDVDFMVVGKDREVIKRRVKEMGEVLEEGLKEWEVDVQVLKLEGVWMDKGAGEEVENIEWMGKVVEMKWDIRVLGVWIQSDGGWESHVRERIRRAEVRWRMMLKLLGYKGKGMSRKCLGRIFKTVVEKVLMYGMELYWDGQKKMREVLQKWLNKGLRRILGAVRSTPVDAMLGELGWKRVEYELDKKVERWCVRLLKRGEGESYGEKWRKRSGERSGVYEGGLVGRLMRGAKKHRLEEERWEVEKEREGVLDWRVRVEGKSKEERKKEWEKGRRERDEKFLVVLSDASREESGRMGIGGKWWEKGEECVEWRVGGGWGLTVGEGEMWGVGEAMERVVEGYRGEMRRLIVGVDNVGVLRRLRKGKGFCGEGEQKVRRLGKKLLGEGWEVILEWVPGHVGIMENEEVDSLAKEAVWEEEGGEMGDILSWGEWESRRKRLERIRWREFWRKERKGEEYFGKGEGGELGHDKEEWFSRFLVWMRTNHGLMGGARYKEGVECCGELESRDHILLRCGKWWEERWKAWGGVYDKGWVGEGWIDMEDMLFGERGVKKLRMFAEGIGWKEMMWERGKWKGEEKRKGLEVVERLRGCGGYRVGRSKEEWEAVKKAERERMRKRRGLLTQATTANATVVTGAKILTKRMKEDGWRRVEGGRIVKTGRDGSGERMRKVMGEIHGNRGRSGKGKERE